MKNAYLALTIFCLTILSTQAAQYAVLVAGSKGWDNYRHQANVYHAYNVLISKGIPADNIITMAYDDLANHTSNPFPGQVFNKPTYLKPGKDVYAGVKIDYRGDAVNTTNFLCILFGDSETCGGNRVLKTTQNDSLLLYFSGSGSPGIFNFPTDDDYLHETDFVGALALAQWETIFNEMVIYFDSDQAGSMFADLPNNTKIYAVTSSNPTESSFSKYCAPDNFVGAKSLGTCLGSLFSVNLWENLESVDSSKQTFQEQFGILTNQVTKSHPQQYGDLNITTEVVGNFTGNGTSSSIRGFYKDFALVF